MQPFPTVASDSGIHAETSSDSGGWAVPDLVPVTYEELLMRRANRVLRDDIVEDHVAFARESVEGRLDLLRPGETFGRNAGKIDSGHVPRLWFRPGLCGIASVPRLS